MEYSEMLAKASYTSDHQERVTELEPAIQEAMKVADADDVWVEFGVQNGGSTRLIAWHMEWAECYGPFHSVEQGPEPFGLKEQIEEIGLKSWKGHFLTKQADFLADPPFEHGTVAFVYFDGDHRKDYVVEDVKTVIPYLRDGAVVAIDDVDQWSQLPVFSELEMLDLETDEGPSKGPHGHHIVFYRKLINGAA